ncbi:MAG: 5-formyltetrahydrofolate cyclo-ligase [Pseudomonadales bacterium]
MQPCSAAFATKAQARQWVWDTLQQRRVARAPLPPHGRIANFAGAAAAARRLLQEPLLQSARSIKVNPDSPQRYVREAALQHGIRVYVPTPRLQEGFMLLDPQRIPRMSLGEAATRATMARWAAPVALEQMPQLDAIVTGCVAVTASGKRAGKGAGYSDLEYAILRELGWAAVPVATTVHDLQVVGDFPVDGTDQPLAVICTPTRSLHVADPLPPPERVAWERLGAADLDAMPVLRELRSLQSARRRLPLAAAPGARS